tara:strand:+ start:229 stop:447 length:219 start_codon:yes stop_codon:yes gene_type:complete
MFFIGAFIRKAVQILLRQLLQRPCQFFKSLKNNDYLNYRAGLNREKQGFHAGIAGQFLPRGGPIAANWGGLI